MILDGCQRDGCGEPIAFDPDGLPYRWCLDHLPIVASAYDEVEQ